MQAKLLIVDGELISQKTIAKQASVGVPFLYNRRKKNVNARKKEGKLSSVTKHSSIYTWNKSVQHFLTDIKATIRNIQR